MPLSAGTRARDGNINLSHEPHDQISAAFNATARDSQPARPHASFGSTTLTSRSQPSFCRVIDWIATASPLASSSGSA